MADNPHPQAQRALTRSTLLHPLVYEGLESGAELARDFFEPDEKPWDGWLFSHLVRYEALRRLKLVSHDGIFVSGLPNTGIALYFKGTQYRVFKATPEGKLPPPRDSEGLKEFYDQGQMPLFPPDPSVAAPPNSRLVFLWDIDGAKSLSTLYLVCPSGSGDDWEPGKEHWRIKVPHPAELLSAVQPEVAAEDENLPLEEIEEQEQDG